mmetsp:Transcript_36531/g.67561  ORF Transcript_36531/g.67561 Transcript_36531/m.67561 type:complete len:299 (+) Transcript_36531:1703-2599(+)
MHSRSLFIRAAMASFSSILPLISTNSFVSSSLTACPFPTLSMPPSSVSSELPSSSVRDIARAISSAADKFPPPATTAAAVALATAASARASLSSEVSSAACLLSWVTRSSRPTFLPLILPSSVPSPSPSTPPLSLVPLAAPMSPLSPPLLSLLSSSTIGIPFSLAFASILSHRSCHRSASMDALRASSADSCTRSVICSTVDDRVAHLALSFVTTAESTNASPASPGGVGPPLATLVGPAAAPVAPPPLPPANICFAFTSSALSSRFSFLNTSASAADSPAATTFLTAEFLMFRTLVA